VSADSLAGTYTGSYYYSVGGPWVISQDTEYVANTDSTTCMAFLSGAINYCCIPSCCAVTFYTTYYSCNTAPPANGFNQFYSGDSLKIIIDSVPQPFPNPPKSYRFFGKRISGKVPVGIQTFPLSEVKYYPSPADDILNLEFSSPAVSIRIYNALGELMMSLVLRDKDVRLDVKEWRNGIYFLRAELLSGGLTKSFLIHR
jgi:hypothetical protein